MISSIQESQARGFSSLMLFIKQRKKMIQLYMTPRYESSVKARKWLRKQGLEFQEIDLLKNGALLRKSWFDIISLLEGDVIDLVLTRSKTYKTSKINLGEMSLSELADYLILEPKLIRQPIIYDGEKLQIGFNPDEMRVFIPKKVRQVERLLVKERLEHLRADGKSYMGKGR